MRSTPSSRRPTCWLPVHPRARNLVHNGPTVSLAAHREGAPAQAGSAGLHRATGQLEITEVIPETRYGWNGEVALAYQVVGSGPPDLLYLPGVLSNVDVMWESEHYARFLRRLAGFARLLLMDRRGYGCSERFSPNDIAPLEVLVDDALVVLDATRSHRAVIFGFEEGTS
jgi:hypothetical protein